MGSISTKFRPYTPERFRVMTKKLPRKAKEHLGKYDVLMFLNVMFFMFLSVFLVPELFREVRETRGINFHLVSSIYVCMVSSYDQKTEKVNEY